RTGATVSRAGTGDTSSGRSATGGVHGSPAPSPRRTLRLSKLGAVALTRTKSFQNYIGGEWVDAASGDTFESINPASGDTIGAFPRSSAEDVDRAVAAAKVAYEEWRLVPAPKRGEILYRFASLLMEEKDDLTDLM